MKTPMIGLRRQGLAIALLLLAAAAGIAVLRPGKSQTSPSPPPATAAGAFKATEEQWKSLKIEAVETRSFRPEQVTEGNIALDDDLNLPHGVGLVFELIREANAALDEKKLGESGRRSLLELLEEVDGHLDVLGGEEPGLAEEVERLIAEREAARRAKDFITADLIREELKERGIALEDSRDGVRWRRVSPG